MIRFVGSNKESTEVGKSPGAGKNWLATLPDKGFFVIFRLYGPKQAFYDQTWSLPDIEKVN